MQRTVLITGASRGIGLELARLSAAGGARVIATARHPGAAPKLDAAAHDTGPGRIDVVGLDVTRPDEVEAVAAGEKNAIDLLVCNAGQYQARGGIDDADYTAEAWQAMLMTNVAGVFFTIRAFLPHLRRARAPKIAVVSSVMASTERAPGRAYAYRASKAAATNLARNLAVDLHGEGIAVGAYHPGWVRTDMGGEGADIDTETSARGLLERFDALTLETSGVFEDYRGEAIPF